jgi:hypothetical protein
MSDKRVMTVKGFLHKTTTKAAASASAFLEAHREFLSTGDVASVTLPILAKVDAKELMPTPALEAIKKAVFQHMIVKETAKAEAHITRLANSDPNDPTSSQPNTKTWTATIYNADGEIATKLVQKGEESIEEELIAYFDHPQEADRWVDRRLFDSVPGCFGVVNHNTITNKHGDMLSTTITRGDAISRMLSKKPGAVMRQNKPSGTLGWGVKSRPSISKFSHG